MSGGLGGIARRLTAPLHRLFSASHSDVDASVTPADGNVPTYVAATGKWTPQAPSGTPTSIANGGGTLSLDASGNLATALPAGATVDLLGGPTGSAGLSVAALGAVILTAEAGNVHSLPNLYATDPGLPSAIWEANGAIVKSGVVPTRLPAKAAVRAATTANGTLATAYENGDTVDGVTLATNDRILLKDQTSGAENGIYVVAASGAPARATDADSAAEVFQGFTVFVKEGTTNANRVYVHTTAGAITLGSTALTFAQLGGGGGGSMSSFTLTGDGGSSQSITDGNTLTVAGGVGLASTAGATDTVTVDLDINSLTADASPDGAADYVATWDASASAHKKVLLDDLPGGGSGALTQIAETLLGSDTATITFSSIPGTYRHLIIRFLGRASNAGLGDWLYVQCNGDTGANYDAYRIDGVGGTLAGAVLLAQTQAAIALIAGNTAPANVANGVECTIYDYARTNWQKAMIAHGGEKTGTSATGDFALRSFRSYWRSTAAITSLTLSSGTGFKANTTVQLYGLL